MTKAVYDCDGSTYEFPVTFGVDHPSQLYAFVEFANGTTKELVRNQDYTYRTHDSVLVTRVDDYRDPWPEGVTLTVMRAAAINQPSGRAAMSPRTFWNRVQSISRVLEQLKEQLDRSLHVGVAYPYLFRASQPYGLIGTESIAHPASLIQGGVLLAPPEFWSYVDHGEVAVVSGDLYAPLVWLATEWETAEMDHGAVAVTDGDMYAPLVTYEDWPAEAMDHGVVTVTAGDIYAPVVYYYDWPADVTDHTATVVSGTLA